MEHQQETTSWNSKTLARVGSGRNVNEAVASAASEAFAGWMHRRYAPVKPSTAGHTLSFRCAIDDLLDVDVA